MAGRAKQGGQIVFEGAIVETTATYGSICPWYNNRGIENGALGAHSLVSNGIYPQQVTSAQPS